MKKADRMLIERRIVFLVLALAVGIPLVFPLGLKTQGTPLTKKAYDMIEKTPAGSVVIISFDYDPSTVTELQPMAQAIIEHAWRKGHKVVATAMWPQGSQMADMAFESVQEKVGAKTYGEDYVNLGYKVGGMVIIQGMGRNLKTVFPKDTSGLDYDAIPLLKPIKSLRDIRYVVSLSAGDPGLKDWVLTAHDKFEVPVAGGTTAVSAPGFLPYVNDQHQLYGLMGGLKAAAEYELLMGYEGSASLNMNPQSVAHVLILILIAIGNVKAWRKRKADSQPQEATNA
ncbi:MAG TPA: hypothetical protein PLG20_06140 [Candidatus Syntrophosphaera sp.]|nr:hypothetical protein [Candidatus Syntrophosphaera sp.]